MKKSNLLTRTSVVRIWRTEIDPTRMSDYEAFARTTSLPMFRAQPGFVGVLFAGDGPQRTVITFWEDIGSAHALPDSTTYRATVEAIMAAGLLRGEQSVETLSLHGFFDA